MWYLQCHIMRVTAPNPTQNGDILMLPWCWAAQAVRPCSSILNALSLIILSLTVMMVVKVLKVNLFYNAPS